MSVFDYRFATGPIVIAIRNSVSLAILIILWDVVWKQGFRGFESRTIPEYAVDIVAITGPVLLFFLRESKRVASKFEQLTKRADFDQLSGLLNRQSFYERFKPGLQVSTGGLVLMIDADYFKEINDTYGHATGDQCIREIGRRLRENLRIGDIAGRVGGEEFAVFLANTPAKQSMQIASRISQPIAVKFPADQSGFKLTMSIGAVWVDGKTTPEGAMSRADELMYGAKRAGRSQIKFEVGNGTPVDLLPLEEVAA